MEAQAKIDGYKEAAKVVQQDIDRLKKITEEQKEIYESQPAVRAQRTRDRRGTLNPETGFFEGGSNE